MGCSKRIGRLERVSKSINPGIRSMMRRRRRSIEKSEARGKVEEAGQQAAQDDCDGQGGWHTSPGRPWLGRSAISISGLRRPGPFCVFLMTYYYSLETL